MNTRRLNIKKISSRAVAIRGNDIDTDRIIPARFMKCITFEGLGKYAFYDVRFDAQGNPKDHPFNKPEYRNASILLVNKNFGCGSSREHAPQALQKHGINAVVGESFAEIFAGNCCAMGIPAVSAKESDIQQLQDMTEKDPSLTVLVDLETMTLRCNTFECAISMPDSYRNSLLQGTWDSTGVLLENMNEIDNTMERIPYFSGFTR